MQATAGGNYYDFYAWAVRSGDVAASTPVPEPGSFMLLGSGLTGLVMFRKRLKSNKPLP